MDWNQIARKWDEMSRRLQPASSLASAIQAKPLLPELVRDVEALSNPITQTIATAPVA
ncbi:hypothetical protein [Cypionkella psychrotolerans]|uniref:hypothetical protein n=1 Tax=Cypionkella psychrotolerans TaxID=1678131 RepID=UPI000B17669C|nr:hypothetical protein [Cypionkella psychrotolerans]